MSLPLARSNIEAHLYMDLHPCECGETGFPQQSSVIEYGDDLASRYSGDCPSCGASREFTFRLPEEVVFPQQGKVVYGEGNSASELLDPGEWLWVADRYASASPWKTSDLSDDDRLRVRRLLASAAAAVDEVMKFIPPDAEAVPSEEFRTEHGRSMYDDEPGRFYRDRLEVVRNTYVEMLSEIDGSAAG